MGIPATPRDGAAVEIIGLLKSALRFVTSLASTVWKYHVADESTGLTYKQWNDLIEKSFEKHFYIGPKEENAYNSKCIDPKLVNQTRIIRDSFRVRNVLFFFFMLLRLFSSRFSVAAVYNLSSIIVVVSYYNCIPKQTL